MADVFALSLTLVSLCFLVHGKYIFPSCYYPKQALISKKDWIEHHIVCLLGLLKPAKCSRRHIGEAKVLSRLHAKATNKQCTVNEESNFCAFGCISKL